MKLIPLEEVEKIWRLNHTPELMVVHPEGQYISLNNIYYLPTIDPVEIIKGRLQELNNTDYDNYCSAIDVGARKKELEELLQKFNPSSHV